MEFLDKLGIETVFIKHPIEDIVFKLLPEGKGNFSKLKGEKEFETTSDNNFLMDSIMAEIEITEEEYNNY